MNGWFIKRFFLRTLNFALWEKGNVYICLCHYHLENNKICSISCCLTIRLILEYLKFRITMSVTNKFNKYKKPVSKDVRLWNMMKLEVEWEDLHSSWQQTRSAPWPPALIPKTLASQRVKLLFAKPQSKAESAQSSLQSCPAGTSTNLLHLRYTQQAGLKKLRKTFILSFIYLGTSRSTGQLQVLCAQGW